MDDNKPKFVHTELPHTEFVIRAPRFGDGIQVNQAIQESLNELQPFLSWAKSAQTVADTEKFIRTSIEQFENKTKLTYFLFTFDDEFIGAIDLHYINWGYQADIGAWVSTKFSGNGYITNALITLESYIRSNLRIPKLVIRCKTTNIKSVAGAFRLGYEEYQTQDRLYRSFKKYLST